MSTNSIPMSNVKSKQEDLVKEKHSLSVVLSQRFHQMGVKYAFGVSGSKIAPLWEELECSQDIEVLHFRHEAGAVFAACEYSIAFDEPVVVLATSGPGIANSTNALIASKAEGAKIIFVSPYTSSKIRGKNSFQETTIHAIPSDLTHSELIFDYSTIIESSLQLGNALNAIYSHIAQGGSSIISLCLPTDLQRELIEPVGFGLYEVARGNTLSEDQIQRIQGLLTDRKFAIWVGSGAKKARKQVIELAEKVGAPVMCSPRAKGIFPESHDLFIGVTGFAGHNSVYTTLEEYAPDYLLVLGTKLGELTSFWDRNLIPERGIIHVDRNHEVFGASIPTAPTFGVVSDVSDFLAALTPKLRAQTAQNAFEVRFDAFVAGSDLLHPGKVVEAIQELMVKEKSLPFIAAAGNSFAWATHYLQFDTPHYRLSTTYGSMGHAVCGVIGMAMKGKAVALVGDGAMLMSGNEVSTAVKYSIPAIWIVLNDSMYNMVLQVNSPLGLDQTDCLIPPTDFAQIAIGMGAVGISVASESELVAALNTALEEAGPCVIDVKIDPQVPAPIGKRAEVLQSILKDQ